MAFSIYKIASVPLLSKYFTVFANVAMSIQDSLFFLGQGTLSLDDPFLSLRGFWRLRFLIRL